MYIKTKLEDDWIELCVNEFKTSTATKATLEQQQQKSVRLNGPILRKLQASDVDISQSYPLILEGRGLQGYLYAIKEFEGLLSAGIATRTALVIPSNAFQMRAFLVGNTLSALFHYLDHMRRYSNYVRQNMTAHEGLEDFMYSESDVTPPSSPAPPSIVFSPSRKRPRAERELSDVED
ncbi:hypothetical protein BGX21_003731 [Mortierella sp. AD011]|nr:hypothetical protein BGX20_000447 [Mortierella sp. AD010]KAF9375644.1 hypothetical protein BGX21_003731 [Mortierella sp. AD011]